MYVVRYSWGMLEGTSLAVEINYELFCRIHWYERYVKIIKGYGPRHIYIYNLHSCNSDEFTQSEQAREIPINFHIAAMSQLTLHAFLYPRLCIYNDILQFGLNIKQ